MKVGFTLALVGTLLGAARATRLADAGQNPPDPSKPAPGFYVNPINDRDLPDPWVLYDGGVYWMTHTTGAVPGLPLWKSTDLLHWTFDRHLLDNNNRPAWVKDKLWAPEIHKVGQSYILIFTARDTTDRLCIGLATAPAITGLYAVQPAPIVREESVGVIDPDIFQDTDGKKYLLWKDDGNAIRQPCHLFIREMNAACTAFAPNSLPIVLLTSQPFGWENDIIEAPEMIKRGSWYYLFYSGNGFTVEYAEGVARSDRPTGGFTRFSGNPVLRRNDTWANPGHGTFFKDSAGTDWHLYHAYHRDDPKKGRVQLLDRVDWKREPGWPAFGNNGSPSVTPQTAPVIGHGGTTRQ